MSFAAFAASTLLATAPDFQTLLTELHAEQDVPGMSAAIGLGDEAWFAGGVGVADLETARAMTAETVLYAGSLSKVFTAVLALQLVERGELSLTDRVRGLGAERPPVTVAHLLSHASGLPREGNFGYWFSGSFPDREALKTYLRGAPFTAEPGTRLHYSNIGYAALGLAIEEASSRSFADALHTMLTRPLGLESVGTPGPAPGLAVGYTPSGRVLPSAARPFAGVGRQVGARRVREYHDAAAMSPAFGLYANARDLGRFARFLLSDRDDTVLSRALRGRMREQQASGWGLGLKIVSLRGSEVSRHDGWFAAHRSHLLLDAERGISVVVMTNGDGGAPARVADALYAAARNAVPTAQKPENKSPE